LNGGAFGRIVGVGRALGGRIVTNSDLEAVLDTTDEWISTRTGIRARHFVAEGENAATLAVEASKKALQHAGIDGGSVDLIICGTSTAPESMPSVACLVGEEIGAPGAGAMDLAAACAGFSYAASVASAMIRSGASGRVLLIGSDAMSTIVDPDDRSTAVLFGDGAGAVVLDAGEEDSGFVDHILGADGRGAPLGRATLETRRSSSRMAARSSSSPSGYCPTWSRSSSPATRSRLRRFST
jgi:3-oxoacyl-[acyl-carrier-protein] synthase-3